MGRGERERERLSLSLLGFGACFCRFDTRTRGEGGWRGRLCCGDDVSNGGGGVDTWLRIEPGCYRFLERIFLEVFSGGRVVLGREFCFLFFFWTEG